MTALELIALANQVLFVGLFVAAFWRAVRQPSAVGRDTLLLFGSVTAVIVIGALSSALGIELGSLGAGLALLLLNVVPVAMMRLVSDFSRVPGPVLVLTYAAFLFLGGSGFLGFTALPPAYELASIAWFLVVGGYAAIAFGRVAARSTGITRRRMTAVVVGAIAFVAAVVSLFVGALVGLPDVATFAQVLALASAIGFYVGFMPPEWLRRAWREPDLRRFLERSVHLVGVADDLRALRELNEAAATAFGAGGAAVGLYDEERRVLRYVDADGAWVEYPSDAFIAGRAFTQGRRLLVPDARRMDPDHAEVYERTGAHTVIAAPLAVEGRRIGAISIYAEREPIFVEDDLWLLELVADQSAVLLEARARATDERTLHAREEAARLKEEFLSAAAHDLRTPLTVILGQAELLERRLARDPAAPVDPTSVARLRREARRLSDLVTELLDVQRLEQGASALQLAPVDLREVLAAVQRRFHDQGTDIASSLPSEPVTASVDRLRMEQVVDNLVENALKYTTSGPLPGRMPEISLSTDDGEARLAVIDHGIGVPDREREQVFERFYRASNVDGVTDTGIGLGLYICRRIVDGHGGRIWIEPTPGGGSTFTVALALEPVADAPEVAPATTPMPSTEAFGDA